MIVTSNYWHLTCTWLKWDNMARASHARHHWHSVHCDETNSLTCLWWWRWWADAKLGHSWWCACTSWWHAEANSCLRCNQCIGSTPSSNSSINMHMVFLGASEPTTQWCIVFVLIFNSVLVVMRINLPKYMFSSSWTYFLSSPWWVCWMGWIACVRTMTCMLLNLLHAINNASHPVCSMSAAGMDL